MTQTTKMTGLVAATHSPFKADGSLNLAMVEKQASHLLANKVKAAFVGGSTGESHSLGVLERMALAQRWSEVTRGSPLGLIVHVGANCLADAAVLADQAQTIGAAAISAQSPSYFKPKSIELLVACCEKIAAAAPALPFYFYDIPILTGVHFPMPEFLAIAAGRIPTLVGMKFTNPDLMAYQQCLRAENGRFDVLWGTDEYLLGALTLGARGAVGSTYNFSAPIFHRMMAAFSGGDLAAARDEQYRAVQLIHLLASFGYMAAAKATMGFLGVDVGAPRLPNGSLTPDQRTRLREALERLGFFDWVRT